MPGIGSVSRTQLTKALKRILFASLLSMLVCSGSLLAQESELDLLLLEVRLDETLISSAIPAYDLGPATVLPLGELARLLSLAIQTQPASGTASGFILNEERSFSLNLKDARVTRAGVTESFDPAQVVVEPDDLYVSMALLRSWLPVELEIERSRLILRVRPLEVLPLQAYLQRMDSGGRLQGQVTGEDVDYPLVDLPYRWWSPPVVDQSLRSEYRRDDESARLENRYTAHLAGDLLGLESSIYFSRDPASSQLRVTLGRHDPDAGLLGPLQAQAFQMGSLSSASVENITSGMAGRGVTVSNRPLTRPTRFDRQTFEGDLTPGWDVELFYNDALVDFQQPNAEGLYRFEDLPLGFGRNDFKLVFHGPLGETRVEQYSYSLAESVVQPGEFQYNLLEHRDEEGHTRSIAQFDYGLSRTLSTTAGFIRAPVAGVERQYVSAGLRTFWPALSLGGDLIRDPDGGSLMQLGVKTNLAGIALDANRMYLQRFYSERFSNFDDPVITRDTLRLNGSIPIFRRRLPMTIDTLWDAHESGRVDKDLNASLSTYAFHTAFTNTLRWRSNAGNEEFLGAMRVSRRLRDMSLRGRVGYELGSDATVTQLALAADTFLGDGYRLTLGVAHELETPETQYSTGFTKNIGSYGLGLNVSYHDTGEVAASVQFFLALGRDSPRSGWLFDARPKAGTGAASVRAFLDSNDNGSMDPGEVPLPGVGFTVNGGRHQARTDAAGISHIGHSPIKQRVNIAVDVGTLEDPQWAPAVPGRSLVPRPGRVAEMNFPIRMTTEIDGTAFLYENEEKRGMGGLELELLDDDNNVVARTTSSWDGFYIIAGIVAGEYWLRVSPVQLRRLGLNDTGIKLVTVDGTGDFINGMDLLVIAKSST
ncbi:hypothetical protein [Kineobactrum salinum]|uniref:Carboxypeptidase regulatory-like domain-containing protein n=1 Tax=Kineobactrum salinum TaxID=2708301 RepID=A0A6C0U7V8_9GAMM|nr:hypothetical protein [Kineobactrum salinum]QIB67077.1 hypothetical protein G3T16_18440 [Kineobactrum salinum]